MRRSRPPHQRPDVASAHRARSPSTGFQGLREASPTPPEAARPDAEPAARARPGCRGVGGDRDARGPRDHASLPLHGGDLDQGAGGPRDRSSVDLRLDLDGPVPRLRVQEGHRAGAVVARLLGRDCSSTTSRGRWTTTSPPTWRTSSTRSRAVTSTGPPRSGGSTTGPATSSASPHGRQARRHRCSEISAIPSGARGQRHLAGGTLRHVSRGPGGRGRPCAPTFGRPAARRAARPKGARAAANGARGADRGRHPDTGLAIVAKNGRFGPYVTELLPDDAPKAAKPRTGSLFKSMTLDTLTLDEAVRLLSLPRVVGIDEDGDGDHRAERPLRAVPEEGHRLSVADERGPDLRHHPRRGLGDLRPAEAARARCGHAAAKELGEDPVSGQPVVVKAGRFGAYVTDGEYNATLRRDDTVESITLERAAELLEERRQRVRRRRRPRRARPRRPRPRRRPPRRRPPRRRPPRRLRPRRPEVRRELNVPTAPGCAPRRARSPRRRRAAAPPRR